MDFKKKEEKPKLFQKKTREGEREEREKESNKIEVQESQCCDGQDSEKKFEV